ncbi:MAG: hypothetical protein BMS9Abin22_428 [Gammaproteobacteria bacterium]|nr:MAG: hypothetical protein BMS9Abin22_428 [Gammaproteobacteria bacterium]
MNFVEFLQKLEERLGYHQIPVNPAAAGIKDIFECTPIHHDLMTRLVRTIYAQHACRKLTDPVNREDTFAALDSIRKEVLNSNKTDVDAYRLMEELCAAIDAVFNERLIDNSLSKSSAHQNGKPRAEVIQLDPFRRNRRLKSWALSGKTPR